MFKKYSSLSLFLSNLHEMIKQKLSVLVFVITNFVFVIVVLALLRHIAVHFQVYADTIAGINETASSPQPKFLYHTGTSRQMLPKTPYQRELVRHFYRSSVLDPTGYSLELYAIFQTYERYLIYWYLTYCDVVTSPEPWTEESIHKECLQLNVRYLVNIVLAAREHFPELNSN